MGLPVYIVKDSNFLTEDGKTYIVYGITCIIDGEIVRTIENVSTSCNLVSNVASMFTLCKLHPSRFKLALEVLVSLGSDILRDVGMYDEVS